MDQCRDCTLPAVAAGRCLDCHAEVAETPGWLIKQQLKRQPKRRGAPTAALAISRACRWCAGPVPDARPPRAWCSPGCKDRTLGRDRPDCTECGSPVKLHGLCVTHYFRHKDRLNSERRDAAKRGATEAERIDRAVVGARDRWRCGICHHDVDQSVRYPDPMSPSLDHVVPLSVGGSHTYMNVRISHLSCNVGRGNRGHTEQLMLLR
jgi:hypothetical protein